MSSDTITKHLDDGAALRRAFVRHADEIEQAAKAIARSLAMGGTVLFCGNGGSAADAQHLAAELVGRFQDDRRSLPGIALTVDSSAVTAIANDYGFEEVFARQVDGLARPGDVLVAISTSGESPNVLCAARRARERGIHTIALTGRDGGQLRAVADQTLVVPSGETALIQEMHITIGHAICRWLDEHLAALAPLARGIVTVESLATHRALWRELDLTVAWTNGCFDLLHAGHLASLQAAAQHGDILVVGLNSDRSVRTLKGEGRPLLPEDERAELLAALEPVDFVCIFDEEDPSDALRALQPDVHVKGTDYADGSKPMPERAVVEGYGGRIEFVELLPDRSTTSLARALEERTANGEGA